MRKNVKQPKKDAKGNRQHSSGVGNQFQPTPVPDTGVDNKVKQVADDSNKKKTDGGAKT